MKNAAIYLSVLLSLFLALPHQEAAAAVISSSTASANGGTESSSDTSNGMTSAADAVFDATNYAHAKTSPGSIGVEARTDNSTYARAQASWADVWSPVIGTVIPPFAIGFKYHLDGVIDPRFLNPSSADAVSMDISFSYDFTVGLNTERSFRFNACYDGSPCGVEASLDGNSLTSNIVYGTNAQGETTFALDYYQAPAPMLAWLGCAGQSCLGFGGDSMTASIDIDPYNSNVMGDFNNSFFNTFSVELIAADANSMLVSEGGRQTTLLAPTNGGTVPEPSSVLLIGMGFAMMVPLLRRKAGNQQA